MSNVENSLLYWKKLLPYLHGEARIRVEARIHYLLGGSVTDETIQDQISRENEKAFTKKLSGLIDEIQAARVAKEGSGPDGRLEFDLKIKRLQAEYNLLTGETGMIHRILKF